MARRAASSATCRDCRTHCADRHQPLAQLHRRDAWLDRCLRHGRRRVARLLQADICPETSLCWRHRFLAASRDKQSLGCHRHCRVDEIISNGRKARSASSAVAQKRGRAEEAGLRPTSTTVFSSSATDTASPPTTSCPTSKAADTQNVYVQPVVAADAVLVTDGRAAYGRLADAAGIAHITCIASAGERVLGSYHVVNVNGLQSSFKGWMARFNGVASRYLPSYARWRRMIERDAQSLTPRHIIAEALGYFPTSSQYRAVAALKQDLASRSHGVCFARSWAYISR